MAELQRINARHGVVWLRSSMLADANFDHGFSTRHGGVSDGAFASMNLAGERSTGGTDDPSALRENRRRFLHAVGLSQMPVATVRQVHGATVMAAEACVRGCGAEEGADALLASAAEPIACMIRVADCVPILVADPEHGAVAAIHAGWRGIVAGVVASTVKAMVERCGSAPARLIAAIGPCAGLESFEVGDEVADAFVAAGLHGCVRRDARDASTQRLPLAPHPAPHVDLFGAVRTQLVATGVRDDSIDGAPLCTMMGSDDYFSHRRDGGITGRMAAAIAPRRAR